MAPSRPERCLADSCRGFRRKPQGTERVARMVAEVKAGVMRRWWHRFGHHANAVSNPSGNIASQPCAGSGRFKISPGCAEPGGEDSPCDEAEGSFGLTGRLWAFHCVEQHAIPALFRGRQC